MLKSALVSAKDKKWYSVKQCCKKIIQQSTEILSFKKSPEPDRKPHTRPSVTVNWKNVNKCTVGTSHIYNDVNVELKVTLHEQDHYRGILQYEKLVCHTAGHCGEKYVDWSSAVDNSVHTKLSVMWQRRQLQWYRVAQLNAKMFHRLTKCTQAGNRIYHILRLVCQ